MSQSLLPHFYNILGRRNTFHVFTLGSIPIFASLPYFITQCVTDPNGPLAPMYLAAFCGSTVAAISIMGGVFAVLPPYEVNFDIDLLNTSGFAKLQCTQVVLRAGNQNTFSIHIMTS